MTPDAVLQHDDSGHLWPTRTADQRPTDLAAAYQDALPLRRLREARGERAVGYKIGFTNRTIWERYAVFAPIWGTVWDTVLDGPLHALLHFVLEMQRCPGAPKLLTGDVVTTGTWTDAHPPAPGDTWRSELDAPFLPLKVRFR